MRDELVEKYKELYGEKPHHKLSEESLKDRIENFKPVENPEPKDEKITISKTELNSLIEQALERRTKTPDLREGSEWREVKEQKGVKTARMRLYREDTNSEFGLVLNKKFLRYDFNEETRRKDLSIYEILLKYPDGEKKIEMPLKEYIGINDFETVQIIDTESKKLVKSVGKIKRALRDEKGYTRSAFPGTGGSVDRPLFGDYVDEEVERIESFHTIKRPNGETLLVHNDQLNG